MENKGLNNKKLTKVLVILGVLLLFVFIIIRITVKNTGDRVTDMPSIGDLPYSPKKEKDVSRSEEYYNQEKKAREKELGLTEEEKYIIPNLNELSKKKNVEEEAKYLPNTAVPTQFIDPTLEKKETQTLKIEDIRNSDDLTFQSDYFTSKKEPEKVNVKSEEIRPIFQEKQKVDETQVKQEVVQKRNPFGTIETNSSQGVPVDNSATFYSAEIYGDQKIENDGLVTIRNTQVITVNGQSIPKNSILYGQATFNGNRVKIHLNRAKTPSGEISISWSVLDNDRIEGIYYQAPIDQVVDKNKEEAEIELPGTYGAAIGKVAQTVIKGGKELMKKSTALSVKEGYKIYILTN
jgi:hypothetical protein